MAWGVSLVLLLGGLVSLLMLGLPVVFAFLSLNIVGAFYFLGGEAGLKQLVTNSISAVANFGLVPIPLFLLMGEVMLHTGLANRAIDAVDRLISKVPGRLSLVAIFGGTIFAALSGSSIANAAMLGSTLMPEMRRRGYHKSLAMGPILGTGGIAVMIPPSALAVLLGSLAGISISDLLIAGIVPGLLMALFFAIYVIVVCTINPALAPAYPMPSMTLWERIRPFLVYVLPLLGIFVVVVGSMLAGLATPTESAALGSLASVVAAACYGKLTWANFKISIIETAKISVMLLFIICASITFAQILTFSDATSGLVEWVKGLVTDPVLIIIAMLAILLFMGCFMDQVSMMMITLPFFMPLAAFAGADPIWFGVLMLILLEIGLITPPFGMILFVMSGIAHDASVPDVYRAALPYILLTMAVVAVIFIWPELALWLPGMLR